MVDELRTFLSRPNPNAPGLSLVLRLNLDGDHCVTHFLFKSVLDTVAKCHELVRRS